MPPSSIARDVFESLPGAWALSRAVEDARMGVGRFEGRASFAAHGDALLYEERGELQLGVWRGPAWRRWLYACEADALVVRYPTTNAELHAFRFVADALFAKHTHVCGQDSYAATLRRLPGGALSLSYAVSGPTKGYNLRTTLTRAA